HEEQYRRTRRQLPADLTDEVVVDGGVGGGLADGRGHQRCEEQQADQRAGGAARGGAADLADADPALAVLRDGRVLEADRLRALQVEDHVARLFGGRGVRIADDEQIAHGLPPSPVLGHRSHMVYLVWTMPRPVRLKRDEPTAEIGRASCRERVEDSAGAPGLTKEAEPATTG